MPNIVDPTALDPTLRPLAPEDLLTDEGWNRALDSFSKSPELDSLSRQERRRNLREEKRKALQGKGQTGLSIGLQAEAGSHGFFKGVGRAVQLGANIISDIPSRISSNISPRVTEPIAEKVSKTAKDIADISGLIADEFGAVQEERLALQESILPGTGARIAGQFVGQMIQSAPTMAAGGVAASGARLVGAGVNAASNIGLVASSVFGGMQSGGETYDSAIKKFEPIYGKEKAEKLARIPSLSAAASTALWTMAFGKTGIESSLVTKAPKGFIKGVVGRMMKQFNLEGGEEGADEITQAVLARLQYDPDMTPEQAAEQAIFAYALGGVLGGTVEGGKIGLEKLAERAEKKAKEQEEEAKKRWTDSNRESTFLWMAEKERAAGEYGKELGVHLKKFNETFDNFEAGQATQEEVDAALQELNQRSAEISVSAPLFSQKDLDDMKAGRLLPVTRPAAPAAPQPARFAHVPDYPAELRPKAEPSTPPGEQKAAGDTPVSPTGGEGEQQILSQESQVKGAQNPIAAAEEIAKKEVVQNEEERVQEGGQEVAPAQTPTLEQDIARFQEIYSELEKINERIGALPPGPEYAKRADEILAEAAKLRVEQEEIKNRHKGMPPSAEPVTEPVTEAPEVPAVAAGAANVIRGTSQSLEETFNEIVTVQMRESSSAGAEELLGLSREIDAQASVIASADTGSASEDELQVLRKDLQKKGKAIKEKVRKLWGSKYPDASRRLQQAIGRKVAVQKVPPKAPQRPKRIKQPEAVDVIDPTPENIEALAKKVVATGGESLNQAENNLVGKLYISFPELHAKYLARIKELKASVAAQAAPAAPTAPPAAESASPPAPAPAVAPITEVQKAEDTVAIVGAVTPPVVPDLKEKSGPTLTKAQAEELDKAGRLQQTQGFDWGKDPEIHWIPELQVFTRVKSPDIKPLTPEQVRMRELEAEMAKLLGRVNMSVLGPLNPKLMAVTAEWAYNYLKDTGLRRFVPFAKAMVEKWGREIKAYLKPAYFDAKKKLSGNTEDYDEPDAVDGMVDREDYVGGQGVVTVEHTDATMPALPEQFLYTENQEFQEIAASLWSAIHTWYAQNPGAIQPSPPIAAMIVDIPYLNNPALKTHRNFTRETYDKLLDAYMKANVDGKVLGRGSLTVDEQNIADDSRQRPKVANLGDWLKMVPNHMAHHPAAAVGRHLIKTEEDVHESIQEMRRSALKAHQASKKEGRQDLIDSYAKKIGFIQSAIEAATGQGKTGEILIRGDTGYSPNPEIKNLNVDFISLAKETPDQARANLGRPFIPRSATVNRMPVVTTMRTAMLEQMAVDDPEGAISRSRDMRLSEAEMAYLGTLVEELKPKADRYVSSDMRQRAREVAKRYGYRPKAESDKAPSEVGYPKLLDAPKGLPTGDRLYRTVHRLRSGARTIAIETSRYENNTPFMRQVVKLMIDTIKPITPAEAATEDHIIETKNGKFVRIIGFYPILAEESRIGLLRALSSTPDPDYISVPVSNRRRVRYRKVDKPLDTMFMDVTPADITSLTEDDLDTVISYIDHLEMTDATKLLLANFDWDVSNRGYQVKSKKPGVSRDEGIAEIDYIRTQPKFVSQMLNLRPNSLIGPVYQSSNGAYYRNVSIPGIVKEMPIPVVQSSSLDEVYARFIGAVADAITVKVAFVRVRQKMGIPTAKVILSEGMPTIEAEVVFSEGAPVMVKHEDRETLGVVVAVRKLPIARIDRGLGRNAVVGIKTEKTFYDIRIEEPDADGKPKVLKNMPANSLKPEKVVEGAEPDWLNKRVLISKPSKKGLTPEIFDGEPFRENILYGVPLRYWWLASQTVSAKETSTARKDILKILSTLEQGELVRLLENLGYKKLQQVARLGSKAMTQEEQLAAKQSGDVIARGSQRPDTIPMRLWGNWTDLSQTMQKARKTELSNMVIDRVAELYGVIQEVTHANLRIKGYANRSVMAAQRVSEEGIDIRSEVGRLEKQIKDQQNRPPSQNPRLTEAIESTLLPERHYNMSSGERVPGPMRYRLLAYGTFDNSRWKPDAKTIDAVVRMPVGKILVGVKQAGQQFTAKMTPEEAAEAGLKTVYGIPVDAFLAIEGGEAKIMAETPSGYRTIYFVALETLPSQIAQEVEHVIPEDVTGGDPMTVKAWYLDPDAILNSGYDSEGHSLWNQRDPDAKDFLSIEDYKKLRGEKLPDTALPELATKAEIEASRQASEILPSDIEAIIEKLLKTEGGRAVYNKMEDTDPFEDDPWEDILQELSDVMIPGWDKLTESPVIQAKMEALETLLEDYRGAMASKSGRSSAISQDAPSSASANQSLFGKRVQGKQAIREMIDRVDNGFTDEARASALKFIDSLPEALLADLTFEMVKGPRIGKDSKIHYAGTFSHAYRLARVVAGSRNITATAEEIAHAIARFLPEEHANKVESMRMSALTSILENPDSPVAARQFAEWIMNHGGAVTSEQFMLEQRISWADYYPLINTDEFFAHNLTDAGMRANTDSGIKGAVQWIHGFLRDLINAVKAWMGEYGAQKDRYFDRLMRSFSDGDFTISANGGYLSEVNAFTDIGAVGIGFTPNRVRKISEFGGRRNRTEVGTSLMGASFNLSKLMSNIESRWLASGMQLNSMASKMIGVLNVTETVQAVRDLFNVSGAEYSAAKASMSSSHLRNQMALGAMGAIQTFERRLEISRRKLANALKDIASDKFARLVKDAQTRRAKVWDLETLGVEVDRQLQLAVKAALDLAKMKGEQHAQYQRLMSEAKWIERYRGYSSGIAQAMIRITNRIAGTPEGAGLLMGDETMVPGEILNAYMAQHPTEEEMQVETHILEGAAWALARLARIRHGLLAMSFEGDQAVLGSIPGMAAKIASDLTKTRNIQAVRRIFSLDRKTVTNLEKAKFLLMNRERRINRISNRLEALEQAVQFGEEMMADEGYRAFRKTVSDDVGERVVPNAWKSVGFPKWGENMEFPLPISGGTITANLQSDLDSMSGEQAKALKALLEIEQWLGRPENQGDMAVPYFRHWAEFLKNFADCNGMTEFSKNYNCFGMGWLANIANKGTQIIDGIIRQYGNRMTVFMNYALRGWRDSYLAMAKWGEDWGKPVRNATFRAAQSHAAEIEVKEPSLAVDQWYTMVGRELFALNNNNWDLKAGDELPSNGVVITKEDMELLELQSKAVDAAMQIDVTQGRSVMIDPALIQDMWVPGLGKYYRKALKLYKHMLPRSFNRAAIDFTKTYYNEGIKNGSVQDKRRLLDPYLHDAVSSWLRDRSEDFTTKSALEDIYAIAADDIRDGKIKNMVELEAFFDANIPQATIEGEEVEDAPKGSEVFYAEFDRTVSKVYKRAVMPMEASAASKSILTSFEFENSFTLGRGVRIAPYWWYDYGFKSDADIINFGLNGSSFYLSQVLTGMKSAVSALQSRKAKMIQEVAGISKETGKQEVSATQELKKRQAARVRSGKETATIDEIDHLINGLQGSITQLERTFVPGGRVFEDDMQPLYRVFGVLLGGLIAAPFTSMRNWHQGGFGFNGQRLHAITGSLTHSYGLAGWEVMKQTLAALTWGPAAAVVAIVRKSRPGASAFKHLRKGEIKEALKALNPASKKFEFDLLGNVLPEFTRLLFEKCRHYKEMERRGLMIPMNLTEKLESIITSPQTMGLISSREAITFDKDSKWQEAGLKNLAAFAKLAGKHATGYLEFQLALLRYTMPRYGDMAANVAGFNASLGAINHLESHLRKRYLQMKESGAEVRRFDQLTPNETLPPWWGGDSKDQSALNMLMYWFNHAGMDLAVSVNDFFDRLDQAGGNIRDVRWLTDEQRFNLAQSHIEELNVATPTNRPLKAREGIISRLVYFLMGWRLNMLSNQAYWMGMPVKREGRGAGGRVKDVTTALVMHNLMFIMSSLVAAGLFGEEMYEAAARAWARYVHGEERSSRHFWEANTGWGKVKEAATAAATIIPYVDMLANMTLNDQPSRRSLGVALPVQNVGLAWLNYAAGVANTRDITYGLDSVLKTVMPGPSRVAFNSLPAYKGSIYATGAQRLLSRYGDTDLLKEAKQMSVQMSGTLATTLTPYANRMVNAAMNQDHTSLMRWYEEAVKRAKEERQIDDMAARKLVRQLYTSRNPYRRTFQESLTYEQRVRILGRMSDSERAHVLAVEELLARGATSIGTQMTFYEEQRQPETKFGGSSSGGRTRLSKALGGGGTKILQGRLSRPLTRRLRALSY